MKESERTKLYLEEFLFIRVPIMAVSFLGTAYLESQFRNFGLWLPAIAMTSFILSEIFDCVTTEVGLSRGLVEINPDFSSRPTQNELYGTRQRCLSSLNVILSGFFPAWGIARFADKMYVGLNNIMEINKPG